MFNFCVRSCARNPNVFFSNCVNVSKRSAHGLQQVSEKKSFKTDFLKITGISAAFAITAAVFAKKEVDGLVNQTTAPVDLLLPVTAGLFGGIVTGAIGSIVLHVAYKTRVLAIPLLVGASVYQDIREREVNYKLEEDSKKILAAVPEKENSLEDTTATQISVMKTVEEKEDSSSKLES